MNSPMVAIPMGGADVVLGVQWLQSLGTVDFNFQKPFMKFSWEGKEYELNVITRKSSKMIIYNGMIVFKKGTSRFSSIIRIIRCSNLKVPYLPRSPKGH